jgi:hypothetical protein
MLQVVFEYLGLKNVSAKIIGPRHKYMVIQALFDAFNNHKPPEDIAFARGVRMQWLGSDRFNPRNFYPAYPKARARMRALDCSVGVVAARECRCVCAVLSVVARRWLLPQGPRIMKENFKRT